MTKSVFASCRAIGSCRTAICLAHRCWSHSSRSKQVAALRHHSAHRRGPSLCDLKLPLYNPIHGLNQQVILE